MSDKNEDDQKPKTPPNQLNLSVQSNASAPKQGFFRRSPFSSPTQKRKQFLPESKSPTSAPVKLVTGSATGNPRNKCALKPGHSLMDWVRLGSSGCDLAGTKGVVTPISTAELSKHNKINDAWLAIRGKVYNVTRYMDFHPGGIDELTKGVGQDATKIFDDVHAWVNYEQLLMKCYIGPLKNTVTLNLEGFSNIFNKPLISPSSSTAAPTTAATSSTRFKTPLLPLFNTSPNKNFSIGDSNKVDNDQQENNQITGNEIIPRFDWIQKIADISIVFYTKALCNAGLLLRYIPASDTELEVIIRIEQTLHICSFKFTQAIDWPPTLAKIKYETGKIECTFRKSEPKLWKNFGLINRRKTTDLTAYNFVYDIVERKQISHDSYAILLGPQEHILQIFPIGYHSTIIACIEGTKISRSYTPVPYDFVPECLRIDETFLPFFIKCYQDGVLSTHITRNLSISGDLEISYPKGNFKLQCLQYQKRIAILAAGSGVTPMLRILLYLLNRDQDKCEKLNFLYFNKTEDDAWCRDKLERIAERDKRLEIRHVLSEPLESWNGEVGRMTEAIANGLISTTSKNHSTFCLVCGPLPFNELCQNLLRLAGYQDKSLHFFHG